MLPRRFQILRPYIASFIHATTPRPSLSEIFYWLGRAGKEKRAAKWIDRVEKVEGFSKVFFRGHGQTPLYYEESCSWVDLCQTIDECFEPKNWHYFLAAPITLRDDDVVVDCGAAEGLFAFTVAQKVKQVYAVEPIPKWHRALEKTFASMPNVEICKVGVGHQKAIVKMTDDEIYSRISSAGSLSIPIETIDGLFFSKNLPVNFIKADVEGFEFPMLLGAESTIRANRPRLALTVYHPTNHFVEIRDFLLNIHSDYQFVTRGISANGNPVLLQAY